MKKALLLSSLLLLSSWGGEYESKVEVKELLRATKNLSGQKFEFPADAEVHALKIKIPAGTQTGWHVHPYSGFAYVVSGQLAVQEENGPTHVYTTGDAFAEVVKTPHNGTAISKEDVDLIVFFFSKPGEKFSIKSTH